MLNSRCSNLLVFGAGISISFSFSLGVSSWFMDQTISNPLFWLATCLKENMCYSNSRIRNPCCSICSYTFTSQQNSWFQSPFPTIPNYSQTFPNIPAAAVRSSCSASSPARARWWTGRSSRPSPPEAGRTECWAWDGRGTWSFVTGLTSNGRCYHPKIGIELFKLGIWPV